MINHNQWHHLDKKSVHNHPQPMKNLGETCLTHWGRVMHICVRKLTTIGSDNGFVPWTEPSHYLNQCWYIVNWTLRNMIQLNFSRNQNIFIQEKALQNDICEMASILSRPQCVKPVVSTVPTDSLASSGVRTSAGMVMIKITACVHIAPSVKELIMSCIFSAVTRINPLMDLLMM